ncbi:uncharacterized protein LOC125646625 isoform X2 [Ostrea edulis]|uniref:uncharacterized protein LOC125646625 isoform X2 n=1 Tax=Ostrea edulis TaxID=37623 RepID=UPI0024AEACB9|nr:uncharacterized protein LOC125646625 isoform X2 [Ostrea edulis]
MYVPVNKTWEEAIKFCQLHEAKLSDFGEDDISSIQTCKPKIQEAWTSSYIEATPYLSLIGCFRTKHSLVFSSLQRASVLDCQYSCSNSTQFAIKGKECACLDDNTSIEESVDASLCDVTCEDTFCGGKNVSNVYSVVGNEFFTNRKIMKSKDFTSCMSYQCINHTYQYNEMDCNNERVTQATCSSFFSCTFEPGDPCFLVQAESNDFNWTITNEETPRGPESAYEGLYFAFVNDSDSGFNKGNKASLVSNIDFFDIEDSSWCLRFRFSRRNTSTSANVTIYTKNMRNSSVVVYNRTFFGEQYVEWKYVEFDMKLRQHDRIFFSFTRSSTVSNFALDDVSLTKGRCKTTSTQNLYMKGEVKCDFEGNQDLCFEQDKGDNFDWKITRNESTPRYPTTGPGNNIEGNYFSFIDVKGRQKGHKAVLISKFELNNVNITFSMYYNMNGRHVNTLRVYLKKTETAEEKEIFNKYGNQQRSWIWCNRTVVIDEKTKLYISANVGNGSLGNIAIDDIRIKINGQDMKNNWMNLNKRCQDRLGVYSVNHKQLANLHCLSPGPERWTGIIRPQRRGTATGVVQHHPTVVQLFQGRVDPYIFVWETFNTSVSRPFVCEKNSSSASCSPFTENSTTYISGEAGTNIEISSGEADVTVWVVLAGVLTVCVVVALLVVYYIRKKSSRDQGNRYIPTHSNATYAHSSENNGIESTSPYDEVNNTSPMGKDDKAKIAAQETFNNRMAYDMPKRNQESEKEPDEDYDHLHDMNTSNTSARNDDVYSHMTGQHNTSPLLADDTYDHTIKMEGEYGAQQLHHDDNETYDHAHVPDEMYSLLHQDTHSTENVYDHAEK